MKELIPVSKPDLSELEKKYLNDAFDSGWISSTGEYVEKFEELWAGQIGTKFALSVSNGTVALHLALAALGIGPGDEVIVPNLTFIATVNAVTYVGAKPILVDVSTSNWGMDPFLVESLISKKTKAIICVHLYGVPCDVLDLRKISDKYGIYLIEDAAEAPFSTVSGRKIGSIGDISTFSFYGNKIITSGEGGAVATSNIELFRKMKLLRDQGMDPERRYFFIKVGFNFRLTNMQCAILVAQLERLDEIIASRKKIYELYDKRIGSNPKIEFQTLREDETLSPWLYTFKFQNLATSIDKIRANLLEKMIDTRPVFVPINKLPPYWNASKSNFKKSESIAQLGISIPTFNSLLPAQINYISDCINEIN